MAALTDVKQVLEKDGVVRKLPVAVVSVYKGALCVFNAGYVEPASSGVGKVFAGVAEESADNSDGVAGDISVRLKTEGRYLLEGAGFAQTDVGATVYASDDQTITKTLTNNMLVGQIDEFVSATQVWVKLSVNPIASTGL